MTYHIITRYKIISTQKQPGCKKGVALFKMASVKKVVKSKGVAKKWLWWCRLMRKFLITTNQVNFVLIPGETRMRQHKLIWIVAIKIFPSTYTITAISWPPPFLFHTGHFKQGRTFFTARLFLSRYNFITRNDMIGQDLQTL